MVNSQNFLIPSRSTSNIVYDETLRQYILGSAAALRNSKNTSQLRSFTQLIWLAFFANRLTNEKKSSTLRDVYYSSQALCKGRRCPRFFQSDFKESGAQLLKNSQNLPDSNPKKGLEP